MKPLKPLGSNVPYSRPDNFTFKCDEYGEFAIKSICYQHISVQYKFRPGEGHGLVGHC